MKLEDIFKDPNSIKIWQSYFNRVAKVTRVLDRESKVETELELQDHLYQSFHDETGTDEISRLLAAIERLGEPEEYLKQIISLKLLQKGTQTLSPKALLKGLFYKLSGGIRNLLAAVFFATGYFITFIMAIMSFVKFIIPDNAGLFYWPDGSWAFGIIADSTNAQEVLGYWIVPLGILIAFIFYYILTRILKSVIKKS